MEIFLSVWYCLAWMQSHACIQTSQGVSTMIETIPFTTKEAWLEARSHDLTSTEIAVLFGKSPYQHLPELWDFKKNHQILLLEENERMFWGTQLQDAIARGLAQKNSWELRLMNEYIRDTDLRIGSSFDYEIILPDGQPAILEIKNVDYIQFKKEWIDDAVGLQAPVHIELQIQHQMILSGHRQAFIGVLVAGNTARIIHRAADPDVQGAMLYKCAEFWQSIADNQAPALDFERDADFILSKYRQVVPTKCIDVRGDPSLRAYAQAYTDLGQQGTVLDKQRLGIAAQLVTRIGDAEKALGPDFSVTSSVTKTGKRSIRVNWKSEGDI